MRQCNNCNGEMLCTICSNQVYENKEVEANLNLLKREAPNEFGHTIPYYKEWDDLFCNVFLKSNSHLTKFLFNK